MDRRTLLQGSLAFGAAALFGTSVSGCSRSATTTPEQSTETPAATTLVAYFSRPGENYYYGGRINLEVGNTQVLAEMLAELIPVVVYRIEAADPYSDRYDDTVQRNVREQEADARPAVAGQLPSVEQFDTVLLGSPIWNLRPPMIMRTFLEAVDLTGKRLFPFVTYAVSGIGSTARDYTALAPGATVGDGLAVQGETVRQAKPEADAWLGRIGLLTR